MELKNLCGLCEPKTYKKIEFDSWGAEIKPQLCSDEIITKSVINEFLVKEVFLIDSMIETNESLFTEKNKLYCEE